MPNKAAATQCRDGTSAIPRVTGKQTDSPRAAQRVGTSAQPESQLWELGVGKH